MNEKLWASLDRTVEWVKYAESKAIAILAIHGITFGFFLSLASEKAEIIKSSVWLIAILGIAVLVTLVSLFFCFRCLNPRLKLTGGISPIYFGSIAHAFKSSTEYASFFKEAMSTEEKITHEVAGQVFVNSQVAWRKFADVGWAMRFLTFSVLSWIGVSVSIIFK